MNTYEAAGRVKSVSYTWEAFDEWVTNQGATYDVELIPDGMVEYDYNASTGLRTSQTFKTATSGNWTTVRTETYEYDDHLDYLDKVTYNDGLANGVRNWTYDAAGNRKTDDAYSVGTWAYDNLNRMTTSARLAGSTSTSWTYQHDILGNRIGRNSTGYHLYPTYQEWDVLNRMTLFAGASTGAGYAYRADGQRIEKVEGATYVWTTTGPGSSMGNPSGHYDVNYATNQPTSRFFYDGQMGFEDDYNPSGTITKVTRNVLGARGIDRISITENSAGSAGTMQPATTWGFRKSRA